MKQEALIIAIDKEVGAVALVSVPYEYFERVTDEFSGIKHVKELEGDREKYLKEYFKPTLEKVQRKYPLEVKYYVKVDKYFWEDVEYLAKWGLELIVDDGLWSAVRDRFLDVQISLVKEGDIKNRIRKLKRELIKAKQEGDVRKEDDIFSKLKLEKRRRTLIMIADNYLHLKKRAIDKERRQRGRKH
ncbi:hypothetical protein A0127_05645 [Thermococcus peptonophilus]|uniref:Uncharacterized protein n=1 Tax=Thermococcus peptonophilus TaxID=53952 RepID=A0A142CV85_9EURY|nr:hypothetical protein A0127_05645 [Thermococcus peptonophilus]